ncbi:MAG: NAD(P)H-dependent oxidoreductase [Pseudomonadota bacterium]
MTTLLRIDSSSRTVGSHSSRLADFAEEKWQALNPNGRVTRRHLARDPIPILSQDTITGFYTPAEALTDGLRKATALSDRLILELQEAETLLLAVPIYNFSVPAALKAWIDQITRIGHTFSFTDGAFAGLVKTRRAIVICAYGANGYLPGEAFEQANYLEPYLRFLLSFLGIEKIEVITVQETTGTDEKLAANMVRAEADIKAAFA